MQHELLMLIELENFYKSLKWASLLQLDLRKILHPFVGANILVSAFTIVVIAVDRWRSVVNTNPRDNNLSYGRVAAVILLVWILAFAGL